MSFAQAVQELFLEFPEHSTCSEEAENMTATPLGLATNCAHHVNLETNRFFNVGVTDADGTTYSMHSMMSVWVADQPVPQVIVHDPPNGFRSDCP